MMNTPKMIFLLLAACAALFPLNSTAKRTNPYKGEIRIQNQELLPEDDSLRVRFRCSADGVKIASRHSVELVPLLIGTDTSIQMPAIAVRGRANDLLSRREHALASRKERVSLKADAPYAVLKAYGRKGPKQVEYAHLVAFEPWMHDAALVIKKDLCGCGVTHPLGVSKTLTSVPGESIPVVIPQPFIPHLTYIAPKPVSTRREIASEAALDFVVSKTDIRPDYMNNAEELARINNMFDSVRNDPRILVRSISIIGYASPEGILIHNKELSEGRARALANYLAPRFNYPRNMYSVVFGGENWEGLRTKVAASDLPYGQKILEIIDDIPVLPAKEGQLTRKRALMDFEGGAPYRYLLHEYYPHLRKAVCKIEYDVIPIDARNFEELLKTHLDKLNSYELYQAAQFIGEGNPRFLQLLQTSAHLHPEDGTANLNAATAALMQGDADAAENFLRHARTDCPEYDNACGMLMILRGNGASAVENFRKAADAGLDAAKANLQQLID